MKGVADLNQRNCQELYKKYEEKAQEAVKRLENGEPFYKIAQSYGFYRDGFRNWMARNGYYQKRSRKLHFPVEIIERAYNHCLQGASIAETARLLSVNDETLAKDLKQLCGYKPLHDGKKRVNDSYFEKIDSEEKAYWLGFLVADGYNNGKGTIEFCQCDNHKDAVEKFRKAIQSQHKISEKIVDGHLEWRISIKSEKMSKDLLNLDIVPNKSYVAIFPQIEESFYPAFIRGYFDGDGCVYLQRKLPKVDFTAASKKILEDLQLWLSKHNINSGIYRTNIGRTPNENWSLQINGKFAAKFLRIIYKNSTEDTRLDSKYNRYVNILNCRPEPKAV